MVVVVDDGANIRSLLREHLQKRTYRVTTMTDGEGSRAPLDTIRPDLVILDPALPRNDGLNRYNFIHPRLRK